MSALPTCNMDAEVFVLRDAAELQATLGGWASLRAGLGLGLIFHVRFSGHAEVRLRGSLWARVEGRVEGDNGGEE